MPNVIEMAAEKQDCILRLLAAHPDGLTAAEMVSLSGDMLLPGTVYAYLHALETAGKIQRKLVGLLHGMAVYRYHLSEGSSHGG